MQKPRPSLMLILFILALITLAPLFNKGLFTSQDGGIHLVRIGYFYQEIARGNPIPKWINELNNGLGYPLFFFVYPLPYYLSSIWRFLGASIIDSLKISLVTSTLLGTLGIYLWIKKVYSSARMAWASSVLYLFTPYRFLDMFVRLAYGEYLAISVLPFCFWSVEIGNIPAISLTISLLLLSHGQMFIIFTPIIFFYSFLRKKVRPFLFSMLFALGVTAFYWLPAIVTISHSRSSLVHQFPPSDHLPTFAELVYSKWGFGMSHPGPFDEMSFQMGLVNWAVLFLVTFVAFKSKNNLARFTSVVVWLSILVMSTNPFHLWNQPFTQFMQFPWRLLSIPLILLPLALATVKPKRIILAILLTLAIYANRNHITVNMPWFTDATDQQFLTNGSTATSTPDEFMPKNPFPEVKYEFTTHPVLRLSYTISIISLILFSVLCLTRLKYQYPS